MATPKQDMKRLKIITTCSNHISNKGAKQRVVVLMPGTPRGRKTRRFSAKGPHGHILTQTHDQKRILVMFKAAQLLTSLDRIRRNV